MSTSPLTSLIKDGAVFIDNSMLELLTTCPRALYYNRILKRIKSGNKPSLNFGSAIHLALEHRYKTYGNISPDPVLLDEQAKLLSEHFEKNLSEEGDYRTVNWAVEIIRRYNERYEIEPFQLLKNDDGKLLVELPFAIPLFEFDLRKLPEKVYQEAGFEGLPTRLPIIYTGRIDLPVLWDDQLFVMDHKTTSMLGPSFSDGMKMSAQQKGYCWAWQTLSGKPVAGYVINALRIKEPPAYLTDPDSPRRGKSTVRSWWEESFVRERYFLRAGELDEWKINAITIIEELFYHISQGYFPMKTSWCNKFGRCAYFDVCTMAPEDRDVMLLKTNFYEDNLWNPLHEPSAPLA